MPRPQGRFYAVVFLVVASSIAAVVLQAADDAATSKALPPAAKVEVDFAKDVKPLFAKYCFKCHGPEKQQSGLRLDVQGDAVRGVDTGPALEVGNSAHR